jgi:hypothetical protein
MVSPIPVGKLLDRRRVLIEIDPEALVCAGDLHDAVERRQIDHPSISLYCSQGATKKN